MDINNEGLKSFLQKMRFRYRVSVLNENTLEEAWHLRLSRLSVFLVASSLFVLTFVLITLLIVFTPIRYYLPGYVESTDKMNVVREAMMVDSLKRDAELNNTYLQLIQSILAGDVKPDSLLRNDTTTVRVHVEELMAKSKREKEFVEKFESDEKFNLSVIDVKTNDNIYVFFRPVKGVISSSFSMQDKQYGIYIITSPDETVSSVLAGTVVGAAYTFDAGWVMQVQHEDDYLSVYKNNNRLLKRIGDNVRAGEAIAMTGSQTVDGKAGAQFYFELWKKGKAVNPEEVIIF